MPLLRRQIVSVLDRDETGRAKAAQSQARNAHRPPKMNKAEHAAHPTAYFLAKTEQTPRPEATHHDGPTTTVAHRRSLLGYRSSPLAPPPHAASPE